MSLKFVLRLSVWVVPMLLLTGCLDTISIPTVKVSTNGVYIAYTTTEDVEQAFEGENGGIDVNSTLVVVDAAGNSGAADVGEAGVVAFAWHPSEDKVAYATLLVDNIAQTATHEVRVGTVGSLSSGPSIKDQVILTDEAFKPFGALMLVTEMDYSIEGDLVMNMLALTEEDLSQFEGQGREVYQDVIRNQVVLVNSASNQLISLYDGWATNITWSPTGEYIAFTAWQDRNGDGFANPSGIFFNSATFRADQEDVPAIVILRVSDGQQQVIDGGDVWYYAPMWVDDDTVAFVYNELDAQSTIIDSGIRTQSIGQDDLTTLVQGEAGYAVYTFGYALDRSQFAYIARPTTTASADPTQALPSTETNSVYVAAADGSNVREVYIYESPAYIDRPVWSADNARLYLSGANGVNVFLAGVQQDLGGQGDTSIPVIRELTLADGSTRDIYQGSIYNSGLLRGIINFLFAIPAEE